MYSVTCATALTIAFIKEPLMGSLYIKTFFVPFPLNICCPTHALATVLLNRLKRFPYQELLSKSDLKLKEEAL